ncbi:MULTISPECIES: hypothetical protein [unclassified Streptosporangium]|nr:MULTISPECIES: hypothetical protein [unclassified Streptosporangium]
MSASYAGSARVVRGGDGPVSAAGEFRLIRQAVDTTSGDGC